MTGWNYRSIDHFTQSMSMHKLFELVLENQFKKNTYKKNTDQRNAMRK